MSQGTDQDAIEFHAIRLDKVRYAIAVCPRDSSFVVAWQCTECATNNDVLRFESHAEAIYWSHAEAIYWAKVRAALHHAEHHRGQ